MNRNAKSLQTKAKKHQVQPAGRGHFYVTSASSGSRYLVTDLADGGLSCTCKWSEYHDTRFNPCSHVLAVEEWLETSGNRSLSFWSSEEEAQRQHRPTRRLGQGVWSTSRKLA